MSETCPKCEGVRWLVMQNGSMCTACGFMREKPGVIGINDHELESQLAALAAENDVLRERAEKAEKAYEDFLNMTARHLS
jgi:hypothetical protein